MLTGASFDQVTFDNTNLTVVDWRPVKKLGDEHTACEAKDTEGKPKGRETRINEFKEAVRANRVLSLALRAQGMNEDADRFAYRAQMLQRQVLRRQRNFGGYLFSHLLDALTGYGYRLQHIAIVYAIVIVGFAALFYGLGRAGFMNAHPDIAQSFIDSLAAFHERVFSNFLVGTNLDPVRGWVTFAEAVTGLIIESTFIAMLVQRLRTGNG